MAILTTAFFSEKLHKETGMTVLLPARDALQPYTDIPVLYLLHGRGDTHDSWVRNTPLERYAKDMPLIIVMPEAAVSYYQDMAYGLDYYSFITDELPAVVEDYFPASSKREKRFIAGLSMGGFGACKAALNNPQKFCLAASFSGILDFPLIVKQTRSRSYSTRNKFLSAALGPKIMHEDILDTQNDLIGLLGTIDASKYPELFQTCGTEDFLYQHNKNFKEACEKHAVPLTYREWPGSHEWKFWDESIRVFLQHLEPRLQVL